MTLAEYLALPENQGANLVMPIPWCPHLEQLGKFEEFEAMSTASSSSLIEAMCRQCDNVGENWVCLSCFSVQCSRYVNEHMLIHGLETDHRYTTTYHPSSLLIIVTFHFLENVCLNSFRLTLSFSDLSCWCYACSEYLDNDMLYPFKNYLHKLKFDGQEMPRAPGNNSILTATLELN